MVQGIPAESDTTQEIARLARALGREVDDLLADLQAAPPPPGPEGLPVLLQALRGALNHSDDFQVLTYGRDGRVEVAVAFLESLVETRLLGGVLAGLGVTGGRRALVAEPPGSGGGPHVGTLPVDAIDRLVDALLAGRALVLRAGAARVQVYDVARNAGRQPEEPQSERVVLGPRDGFVELLDTNLALIRQRLPSPNLVVRILRLGELTRTRVALLYLAHVVSPELVAEVVARLQRHRAQTVLGVTYIGQWIEDRPHSPFPQFIETERPDRVVANLVAGRVAILVDGGAFALIGPATLSQLWQSPEDYDQRWLAGSFMRLFRVIAAWVSLLLPSLYVSFVAYHPEMIPTTLALPIAATRAGVPLPTIGEVFFLEFAVEVLREASIRLPRTIGPTISIVGGLIIGEAVVRANIVSPLVVIVVATTAIGSFVAPIYGAAFALRVLRFPLMVAAAVLGLYGVMLGLILIVIHLADLRSLGVPYMGPVRLEPQRDTSLFRAPLPQVQRGDEVVRRGL